MALQNETTDSSDRNRHGVTYTIFMPTYNRAHTLARAFESIEQQSYRDFEVVIIDDGSTDQTRALVQQWSARVPFPVYYIWQRNQGRHVAFNTALPHLHGELTVFLDSDDKLTPQALAIFLKHWRAIPEQDRPLFAGVEGLTALFDGRIAGSRFPADVLDSDYFEIRNRYRVHGDKKFAIRSDVLRRYPYPQFPGERHIRPSMLWKRIAHDFRTRYVNEVVQLIEYQADGLSSNRFCLRMRNPNGYCYYYREDVNRHSRKESLRERVKICSDYVRYALHSGKGLRRQWREIMEHGLWLLALPQGLLKWVADKLRAGRCKKK